MNIAFAKGDAHLPIAHLLRLPETEIITWAGIFLGKGDFFGQDIFLIFWGQGIFLIFFDWGMFLGWRNCFGAGDFLDFFGWGDFFGSGDFFWVGRFLGD